MKIYLIPGLGETTRFKNYRQVIKIAKENKIQIVPVNIKWEMGVSMSKFIEQADKQIPDNIESDYIFGFSFGAYIASVLSTKKKAKGYIFCSISPYFKDDLKFIPEETKKYFGKVLMDSFKNYSFPKNAKGKAWFLIGDKDWEIAKNRAKKSYDVWRGEKEINIIKGVGHELSNPDYIKIIERIIRRL